MLFFSSVSSLSAAEIIPANCAKLFKLPETTVSEGDKKYMTKEVCDAYEFLLTRQTCSSGQGITGESKENCVLRLDKEFAVNLAKLFKSDPHFTSANIFSGYRTAQGEMLVSGKSTGNHRRGCAVDLTGGTWNKYTCGAACQHVMSNSASLKLKLPYHPGTSGEANHAEPTTACSGSPGTGPQDPSQAPTASPFRPGPPSLANLFGMQPAPSTPTNFPQQALPARQNPFSYIQPPAPEQTPSATPNSTAITPTGALPISATSVAINPISTMLPSGSVTPEPVVPPASPTGANFIEQINAIANPTTTPTSASVSVASSTSIAINSNVKVPTTLQGSIAQVTPATQTAQSSNGTPKGTPGSTSTFQGAPVASQTFISDDMRARPIVTNRVLGSTELYNLLEAVKQILLNILNILRPFGSRPQVQLNQQTFYENGN